MSDTECAALFARHVPLVTMPRGLRRRVWRRVRRELWWMRWLRWVGGEVMITRAYKVPSALTYGTQIDPFAVEEFKSDFVVRVEVMKTWKFKYERGHETIWEPATIILYKILVFSCARGSQYAQ